MEETGYTPVAHFILPEYCWLDCFYKPMQENIPLFLEKYYYGYVFYIGMKNK